MNRTWYDAVGPGMFMFFAIANIVAMTIFCMQGNLSWQKALLGSIAFIGYVYPALWADWE
jgi:hypothetical protein